MQATKKKKYNYFIGIDVSKNKLDWAVIQGETYLLHNECNNDVTNISEFIQGLTKLPKYKSFKTLFVMEYTGIYCNHLLTVLKRYKMNFVQENSLKIRNSSGLVRGKYDKIDAIRIARYAQKNASELNLWVSRRPAVEQLANLTAIKDRLQNVQTALKKPLKEQLTFVKKGVSDQNNISCRNTLLAIENDILDVQKGIDILIKSDENLNRLKRIITSVPNVGTVTAIQIILTTNEFTQIDTPKKFACYAGVAPFVKNSGTKVGKGRVSHIANKKIKSLLHMCAISAIRGQGEIREFYLRKTHLDGKPKMSVINAVRYKLILRIFACLKENRLYVENYRNEEGIKIDELTPACT